MTKWGEPRWRQTRLPFSAGGKAQSVGDDVDPRTAGYLFADAMQKNRFEVLRWEGHLVDSALEELRWAGVIDFGDEVLANVRAEMDRMREQQRELERRWMRELHREPPPVPWHLRR